MVLRSLGTMITGRCLLPRILTWIMVAPKGSGTPSSVPFEVGLCKPFFSLSIKTLPGKAMDRGTSWRWVSYRFRLLFRRPSREAIDGLVSGSRWALSKVCCWAQYEVLQRRMDIPSEACYIFVIEELTNFDAFTHKNGSGLEMERATSVNAQRAFSGLDGLTTT